MSLYQNIRGALQATLAGVSGIPAAIVYEGQIYRPQAGTPFVECRVLPATGRPATMGSSHLILHEGAFEIVVVYPLARQGQTGGTGPAEAVADAIKEAFNVSTPKSQGGDSIRFDWAERRPLIIDEQWVRVPISVSWYIYSTEY